MGAEKSTAQAKQNNISFENPMYSANSDAANSDQKENPLYDDADMDEHDDLYDEFEPARKPVSPSMTSSKTTKQAIFTMIMFLTKKTPMTPDTLMLMLAKTPDTSMSTRTMKTAASTTISKEKSKTDMFFDRGWGVGTIILSQKKKEKKSWRLCYSG